MPAFTKSFEIRGTTVANIKTDIETEIDAHVAAFDDMDGTAQFPWQYKYLFATMSLYIKAEVYDSSTADSAVNTWRCILREDTGYATVDVTLKFMVADFLTAISAMIAASNRSNIGVLTGRCRLSLEYETTLILP